MGGILYYADQSKTRIIGVTGTDGKTTTTYFFTSIFEKAGHKVGTASTVRYKMGDTEWKNNTDNTTPGRFQLRKFIKQAISDGCDTLILEVTSWGLVQSRVSGINFDAAVITNLTYEHLDLHGNFLNYKQAKGLLFQMVADGKRKPGIIKLSCVNKDDENYQYYLNFSTDKKLTYSLQNQADITATEITPTETGTQFKLTTPQASETITLKLPGLFNVYNALAAAATAHGCEISINHIKQGLEAISYVPGRMEIIQTKPFGVIVDFAHTPNGLTQLFKTAKTMYPQGRTIAVYGATGGRDPGKRPLIGEAAAQYADFSILTSEDPRNEDPEQIAQQITKGLTKHKKQQDLDYIFIKDRAEAIKFAVNKAQSNDVVLLCSMGAYEVMYVGDSKIPWDDRVEARKALQNARPKALEKH